MMSDKIIVRNAVVDDIDALVSLLEQLFSIEKDFNFETEKQKKGLVMLINGCGKHRAVKVAQYKNKVVGMCSVQTRISTAQGSAAAVMEDLVVNSKFRNAGVGRKLLKAVYEWSGKRGVSSVQLLADMDNQSALGFYCHQKWRKTNLICLTKTI